MLIRSQDKKSLIDINGITIKVQEINRNNFKLIAYGNNQPADEIGALGIYDSEYRAIEIIDCIQDAYEDSLFTDCDGITARHRVFEMPEE